MSTVYWTRHPVAMRDILGQWYLSVDNTPVMSLTQFKGYFEIKLFIDNTIRISIEDSDVQRAKKRAILLYKSALNEYVNSMKTKLAAYEQIQSCL